LLLFTRTAAIPRKTPYGPWLEIPSWQFLIRRKRFWLRRLRPLCQAGEAYGPVAPNFNDSAWRALDLPHDWMVEQEFVKSDNENVLSHGFKPAGRIFPESTIGWYRRAFHAP